MKTHKLSPERKLRPSATMALVCSLLFSNALANTTGTSIGLNFASTDPDFATSGLAGVDSAGVVPSVNWNNLPNASGSLSAIVADSSGVSVATPVAVTWSSPNTWRSGANNAFPVGPNRKLMSGYLDTGNTTANGVFITVSNLPPSFTNNGYEVYVYFARDAANNTGGAYTITNQTGIIRKYGSTLPTASAFVEDPGTDLDNSQDGCYLRFTGLSGDWFTLKTDTTLTTPNGGRAPVSSLEIVALSGCTNAGIATPAVNRSACSGSTVLLSVSATGSNPSFQWRRNGVSLLDGPTGNGSVLSGTTSPTLIIGNSVLADSASEAEGYDCNITVACDGSSTNTARVALTINPAATVFAVTGGGTDCSGAGLPVGLAGSELGVDYRLRTNGVFSGVVLPGTGLPLDFGNQILSLTYTVQASNTLGGCTALMSSNAIVIAGVPAAIVSGPTPASLNAYERGPASFSIAATGSGLTYQWQRDGTNLSNGSTISGATSSNLTIVPVAMSDAVGSGHGYRCNVSGICGSPVTSGEAVLVVQTNLWFGIDGGLDKLVAAVAVSGNDLYVGVQFTSVAGITVNHIAKWNGSTWSALGSGIGSGGGFTVREVRALAVSGNDVYAAGYFGSAGGVLANHIAKWDGTSWSALGSGLNQQVVALAVSGNDVYAGGYFTNAGGFPANYVAKWNGSSWSALGTGLNSDVRSLTVVGNDLYVGGTFTNAGGVAANRIAKWNGGSWSALGSGMSGNLSPTVYGLVGLGSDLYAAGRFTTAGGAGANSIAKWNGSSWSALVSGLGGASGAPVYTLALANGDLYAGGQFNTAGGGSAINIAKWNGSTWSQLGAGCNDAVNSMAVSSNVLFAGGVFTTAGTITSPYLAKWIGNRPPVVAIPISDTNGIYGTPFNFTFTANTFNDPDEGQTLTYSASGLPSGITFTPGTRTFSGTPTLAGTHTAIVTATDNGSPPLSTNDTFDIVIAQAPLSITASNATRLYGEAPPYFIGNITGETNGDIFYLTFNCAADFFSPPGNYPIVPEVHDNGNRLVNYTITTNEGTLTVSPALLTVTAFNASCSFGTPIPALTGTLVGLRNGDNITASFETTATNTLLFPLQPPPPGQFPIALLSLNDPDAKLSNYTVSTYNGTLTIDQPAMAVFNNNQILAITWPGVPTNSQLKVTTNFHPPVIWQPVTFGVTEVNGTKLFIVTNDLREAGRMFRVEFPWPP